MSTNEQKGREKTVDGVACGILIYIQSPYRTQTEPVLSPKMGQMGYHEVAQHPHSFQPKLSLRLPVSKPFLLEQSLSPTQQV